MTPIRHELWENVPEGGEYTPYMLEYRPEVKKTDAVIYLVPGSGYKCDPSRPVQEGDRVARYLIESGITVFVLIYRVGDECYPCPILDGRRGMRYLRYNAEKLGIDPDRIISLGYSAGGHLCASLVSFKREMPGEGVDELDELDFTPNYQALCYPVISFDTDNRYTHRGSVEALLGEAWIDLADEMSFETSMTVAPPPTFLFHNFDDKCVGVQNSLLYACRIKELGGSVEMHIYPDGDHGVGYAIDGKPSSLHNRDWIEQLIRWLKYNGIYN